MPNLSTWNLLADEELAILFAQGMGVWEIPRGFENRRERVIRAKAICAGADQEIFRGIAKERRRKERAA